MSTDFLSYSAVVNPVNDRAAEAKQKTESGYACVSKRNGGRGYPGPMWIENRDAKRRDEARRGVGVQAS